MSNVRYLAWAAPIGSGMMAVAALSPRHALEMLGNRSVDAPLSPDAALMTAFAGAVLLALGLSISIWRFRRPTGVVRGLFLMAALALLASSLLGALATTYLAAPFDRLSTSPTLDLESFLDDIQRATAPAIAAHVMLAAAAILACAAAFRSEDGGPLPPPTLFALVAAAGASFLLAVGYGLAALHARRFTIDISAAQPPKPAELAASLNGILVAEFGIALGLSGFSVALIVASVVPVTKRRHAAPDPGDEA